MYKIFVRLGAYFLLILSVLLFVPYHVAKLIFRKIYDYLGDVGYKAEEIIESWGRSDEK